MSKILQWTVALYSAAVSITLLAAIILLLWALHCWLQSIPYTLADSESDEEDFLEDFLEEDTSREQKQAKPPKIPHRWRVTIMMALAFVLCNMDKVGHCQMKT